MRSLIVALLCLLVLGACSGPAAPAPAVTATLPVHVRLTAGKVDPSGQRLEAAKGTRLVLTIDSDHADAIHVHGYDIEIPVAAGETVTREVVLDRVGRFEVESHEPALTILQLIVS